VTADTSVGVTRSVEHDDTNSPRWGGPERASSIGLLARVDMTAALDIMPQNCFGGLARRRTSRWPTWPTWPTGRTVRILPIEIRPV